MDTVYYIGLDIDKQVIACCIKAIAGRPVGKGIIEASRRVLGEWSMDTIFFSFCSKIVLTI